MNEKLKQILKHLEYDKIFIKTDDGYDNKYLNEFNNWTFTKAYSYKKNDYDDIIIFESNCAWNEQIWESLMPIRKKCLDVYGYDIIPLDFDMCSRFNFWDHNIDNYISKKYINKIRHIFNKSNIKCEYLIGNKEGIMPLIKNEIYQRQKIINGITYKFKRKQRYQERYLTKYFHKLNMEFESWTYYSVNE